MSKYFKNEAYIFSIDTVKECLKMANVCLTTAQSQCPQNVYGMASVILLTSAIDIMGAYYENGVFKPERLNKIGKKENVRSHFEAFFDILMSTQDKSALKDKGTFVSIVYEGMRCKSVHNGQLRPKIYIINQDNDKTWIEQNKKTTKYECYNIYLPEFIRIIEKASHTLEKMLNTENVETSNDYNFSSNTGLTNSISAKYI